MGLMSVGGRKTAPAHGMLWQTKEPGTLEQTYTAKGSCTARFEAVWLYGNVSHDCTLTVNGQSITPTERLNAANGYAVWELELQSGDTVLCRVASSNLGNTGQAARQFLNYIVEV